MPEADVFADVKPAPDDGVDAVTPEADGSNLP